MNSAVKLLDKAAENWQNKVGIADEVEALTFGQWQEESQAVAGYLLSLTKGRGELAPVIVCLPKSVRALVAFMGILYSGNPYVPVDAHIPMSRLEKIVENLSPAAIITNQEMAPDITVDTIPILCIEDLTSQPGDKELINAAVAKVTDADPIYIMYTSGSTGVPKGVVIPHRGVLDYANWVVSTFDFDTTTILGNQAPFYFDNSIYDIYGCLLSGARLELIPEMLFLYPLKLPEFLEDKGITAIFWVPTVMINVANSGALAKYSLPNLSSVAFCGEVMPNAQLNIWRREVPHCRYANLYGPTEITDVCCWYDVKDKFADSDPLPIGVACGNSRVLILDEHDKIAPPNTAGELCVVGSGVALGYWNAPEISQKVFVADPTSPNYYHRMYRTGDLAYVREDGNIMFLGRKDSQIKFKGNRIELGEIETAAACVEGVENACALFNEEAQEIVLFVETKEELRLRPLNRELKKYIPSYMLPNRLVTMAALPHTPNDKIDRVTLKATLKKEEAHE